MGLDKNTKTPCGFAFVLYCTRHVRGEGQAGCCVETASGAHKAGVGCSCWCTFLVHEGVWRKAHVRVTGCVYRH